MKYPKTVIKFEGEMKTFTSQLIFRFFMGGGKTVHWTDLHELTVIHKEGKSRKEESK